MHPNRSYAQTKRTLIIPLVAKEISLDPRTVQDQSSLWISRHINCQLMRSSGRIPELEAAKEFRFITPTEIQVTLKGDITFTNGATITAEDVVASFQLIKNSRMVHRNFFRLVSEFSILSKEKLLIKLARPVSNFTKLLSSPNYSLFPKEFIARASTDPKLWTNPPGCGTHRVEHYLPGKEVVLLSRDGSQQVQFDLIGKTHLSSGEAKKYDLIGFQTIDGPNPPEGFRVHRIFDPYQIFLSLNTKRPLFKDRKARCGFLSHVERAIFVKSFGDSAVAAQDIYPKGVLGFSGQANFENGYKKETNTFNKVPKLCVSRLAVSVGKEHEAAIRAMLNKNSDSVEIKNIENPREFGISFQNQACDLIIMGLKSLYLDGYEFLLMFSEPAADVTGAQDLKLKTKIFESQDIDSPNDKATIYRDLSLQIQKQCTVLPLLTIPYRKVYVGKNFPIELLGRGALHGVNLDSVR
jgi:ABC-type oligopeptide transport system substrate-binding subunit